MPHEVSLRLLNQRGWDGHACKRGEIHTKFWEGNVNAEIHLAELGIKPSIILGWIVGTYLVRVRTGFIWLKRGSFGMLFEWTIKLQKRERISWPPQWLLTSQERLTPWSEFWCLGKAEFSVHLEQQILHHNGVHHLTSYRRPNKVPMTKIITYLLITLLCVLRHKLWLHYQNQMVKTFKEIIAL